jgi:hypothetical protein
MLKKQPRFRGRLRWEILGVLTVKVLGLGVLHALFFAPSERPVVTAQSISQYLIAPSSQAPGAVEGGGAS